MPTIEELVAAEMDSRELKIRSKFRAEAIREISAALRRDMQTAEKIRTAMRSLFDNLDEAEREAMRKDGFEPEYIHMRQSWLKEVRALAIEDAVRRVCPMVKRWLSNPGGSTELH